METTNSSDSWENALKHDGNLVIQCTSPNVELELLWRLTGAIIFIVSLMFAGEALCEFACLLIATK